MGWTIGRERSESNSISFIAFVAFVALVAFDCNTSMAQDVIYCFDHDPVACKDEANRGLCFRNPTVVSRCRYSCRACDEHGCSNNISIGLCEKKIFDCFNASTSEFMAANCSQSCGLCAYNPLGSSLTPQPFESIISQDIFVTNETHILKIDVNNPATTTTVVNQDGGNIVALAVDAERKWLFWSNNALSWRGIYRSNFNGSFVERIVSEDILEVNGMAVDSVAGHVYWTDGQRRRVEMADYDGNNRKVIAYTDLGNPRGIVVDSTNGFLYWNDQGTRRIERSQLDGQQRATLVEKNVGRPNQMTLGTWQNTSKLFWVDSCDAGSNASGECYQTLNSFNLLDKSVVTEFNLSEVIGSKVVFGLAIEDHLAYVSVWQDCSILEVDLSSGAIRTLADHLGREVLFSIALTGDSISTNETQSNPCSQPSRGGCTHLCIPLGGSEYRCSCPTFGALVLAKDGNSCAVPSEFLLYCDAYYGHVGFIDVSSDPMTRDLHLIAYSSRPIGVAYDPVNQTVYWSDVKDRTVYQIPLSGVTTKQTFIDASQGLGMVDGLILDRGNRKLYFTNMDFVTVDGVAYSWHRIEVIGLDGKGRRNIVTDVEKPRGLWVDSQKGFLYYTDWGSEAKVVRTNLDGSGSVTILGGLENPNGVVGLGTSVYVIDSLFKTREGGGTPVPLIYRVSFAADGAWSVTKTNLTDLQTPFGIASNGTSTLFLSDWDNGTVISYDTVTGRSEVLMNNSGPGQPASLLFTQSSAALDGNDGVCRDANCSDICLQSVNGSFSCACPSDGATVLSENSMDCIDPGNFLLIADMASIEMVGLEYGGDRSVYRLVSGQFFNDMTAIAFDVTNRTVYYSDSTRRAIYRTVMDGRISAATRTVEILQPGHVIEDMALDHDNGYLYWTAFDKGLVARLKLDEIYASYEVLISNTSQPRAIALDVTNRYVYWTTVGNDSGLWRSTLEGSDMKRLASGIIAPNGLYLDAGSQSIYVLDGINGSVFQCTIRDTGTICQMILVLPGNGPYFGLVLYENLIYYTDWGTHSVNLFDPRLNTSQTVAADLMRPTRLVLRYHKNITEYCVASRVLCVELCFPLPGGYQCGCRSNETLAPNGYTCIPRRNTRLPPRFLYCPKDIISVTRNTRMVVWWRDPVISPVVQANYQSAVTCSLSSGSEFGIGSTSIKCSVSNNAGLQAACNFNVTVVQVGYSCPDPPSPVNGRLNCVELQQDGNFTCQVVCDVGYTALYSSDSLQHQCLNGSWSPSFSTLSESIVCLKLQGPSQEIIIGLRFPGQCPSNDSQFDSDFRTTLSQELYSYGLCDQSELLDMCNPANYGTDALCSKATGQRQRRQAPENPGSISVNILPWASTSENQSIVSRIQTLKDIVAAGQFGVNFRDYSFTAAQIDSVFNVISCPTNWMKLPNDQCAECSDGSFYSVSNQNCSLCGVGTYQPLGSQDSCLQCPTGTTSNPGSFNSKQCYVIIATEPTSAATGVNSNRIPLIVGLCVGLGGGLLLILAVVLLAVFLHRRKVQREKEVTGTGGRTGNTTDARGRNSGIKQSTYLAWPEDDGDPNAQPVQLALSTPIDPDAQPQVSTFLGSDQTHATHVRRLSSGESVRVIPMPTKVRPSRGRGGLGRGERSYQMHQMVDRPRTPTASLGVYRRNGGETNNGEDPTLPGRIRMDADQDGASSTGWKSLSSNEQTTV